MKKSSLRSRILSCTIGSCMVIALLTYISANKKNELIRNVSGAGQLNVSDDVKLTVGDDRQLNEVDSSQPVIEYDQFEHAEMEDSFNQSFEVSDEPSLQGTDIPNGLNVDDEGNLIVTPQLKQLFDYYFTLVGRKDEVEIVNLLESYISENLMEPAKSQAMEVLKNFRLLQADMQSLPTVGLGDIEKLVAFVNERDKLRRQYLGDEVTEAFYGLGQVYDEYTLRRLAIEQNNSFTTDAEKTEALNRLLAELPPSLKIPIQRRQHVLTLGEKAKNAEKLGMTAEELFVEREALVGYEAAMRFRSLDEQRERWKQRYQTYRQEVDQIGRSDLSIPDKNHSLEDIKNRLFSNSELKRVDSLDRIGDRPKAVMEL